MIDGPQAIDLRVFGKRDKRMADHRLPGQVSILFRQCATETVTAAGSDNKGDTTGHDPFVHGAPTGRRP
jgi:hypothetical protein